jgi:uncharacterized protein (TIGR02145 family)
MKYSMRFLIIYFIPICILYACEKKEVPTVVTTGVIEITTSSALGGGNITSDGNSAIIARGVCYGTESNPTLNNNKTSDGTGTGVFVSTFSGLSVATVYHVRAYATNEEGTGYGTDISFTTSGALPVATTLTTTDITTTSATLNGTVNANYLSTVVTFEYGATTDYGQTAIAAQSPLTGNTDTNVSVSILNIYPGTTYHFRVKAINDLGTTYSSDLLFVTLVDLPTITTNSITEKSASSAVCGGVITSDGGGYIFERGVCWNIIDNPTITDSKTDDGTGTDNFTSAITGLTPFTKYYVRAYAKNNAGTGYGSVNSFTTLGDITFNPSLTYGTVTDIDGNIYKTIVIGTQTWMAENLRTTKYSDGSPIPFINTESEWTALTTTSKALCWYNDNINLKYPYGAYYTWAAAMNDAISSNSNPSNVQGVCPTGWHLPSDNEWTTLTDYLGGADVAGGKLKETGTIYWQSPNTGATNESGYTALPGGHRNGDGTFGRLGTGGYWWSCTESIECTICAWYRPLIYDFSDVFRQYLYKLAGVSVRCIRD